MNKETRKSYSQEFKIEAVRLIEEENYSLSQAAFRLGVSKSVLGKWKGLYSSSKGFDSFSKQSSGLSLFEQKEMQKELD